MKSSMLAVLAFLVLAGVPSGSAQIFGQKLVATIPFEFHAAGRILPSGRYEVNELRNGLVRISRTDHAAAVAALTRASDQRGHIQPTGVLRFERYGAHYRLSMILAPGESVGHALPVPKTWKAVRESQASALEGRIVEIALNTVR